MRNATVARFPVWTASLLVLMGLAIASSPGHGQPQYPPVEHFKAYRIQVPQLFTGQATLRDQFGISTSFYRGPLFMAPPAAKNEEPVQDTLSHLDWYDFPTPEPVRTVVYRNQFGEYTLTLRDGRYMLVPSLKNAGPAVALPESLSHFKCYQAEGVIPSITVTLQTQFGTEVVQVAAPELFCNPADKQVGGAFYPLVNPDEHLVCYRITPPLPIDQQVFLRDQLCVTNAFVLEDVWLCVPSLKLSVTDTKSSTWGKVKTIYR